MRIEVHDFQLDSHQTTVERMIQSAPNHFALNERVPGAEGEAFDLKSWYRVWRENAREARALPRDRESAFVWREPSHLKVEAVDAYQAIIPWGHLEQAGLLYRLNGAPISKGFPLRLYVPDGSSKCMNVKGVIKFHFVLDQGGSLGNEPVFGFKNKLSAEDLKKGF